MRAAPEVVLWDADGVLQERPGGQAGLAARFATIVGVDGPAFEEFVPIAIEAEKPSLRGEQRWVEVLPQVLARWGAEQHAAAVLDLWCDTQVHAPSLALALRVREQGPRCWIASNQDEHRARVMEERFGYSTLLDGAFYSHELGAAKPDATYFERVLERLGTPPGAVVFVDDRADNVETARALGLGGICWTSREGTAVLTSALRERGVAI